jgi:hypothetical protein
MPVSYYDQLKLQLTEAATAKKAALDAAYDRATTATFDASGNASYKKDASGNNIYGTRDVQYLEQKRKTATGAESSGTLRSGQNLRNVVNDEAAYRADIATAAGNLTAQKDIIDTETATKAAEYKAMYGDGKGSTGSGAGARSGSSGNTGLGSSTAAPARTTTVTSGGKATGLTPAQQSAWANALRNVPASRAGNRTTVKAPAKTVVPKRIGGY